MAQLTRVIFLLGAGVVTTIIANNGSLPEFVFDLKKVLAKHLGENEKRTVSKSNKHHAEIAEQINKLRQELKYLSTSREVTVVNAPQRSWSVSWTLVLPAVLVGAAGYGYIRWKGMTIASFMYVTKRQMADALSGVTKQFDTVSESIATVRRHVSSRLDGVNKTLEESSEANRIIQTDVIAIKGDVSKCGDDVQVVQLMVQNLEEKIDQVHINQEFAKQGIRYLVQRISGLTIKSKIETEAPKPALGSASLPMLLPDVLSGDLKDLAEKLEENVPEAGKVANPSGVFEDLRRYFGRFSFV